MTFEILHTIALSLGWIIMIVGGIALCIFIVALIWSAIMETWWRKVKPGIGFFQFMVKRSRKEKS